MPFFLLHKQKVITENSQAPVKGVAVMSKKTSMPEIQVDTTPASSTLLLRTASFSASTASNRRSYGSCGSSAASPDTEEFESLERRLTHELEQKLQERRESEHRKLSEPPLSPRTADRCKPKPGR